MAQKEVERLLIAGGESKNIRSQYDHIDDVEEFTKLANSEGYNFTSAELVEVIRKAGDVFESNGNPRKKQIWWK